MKEEASKPLPWSSPEFVLGEVAQECKTYVNLFKAAFSGKSREKAVRAMCIQCMGYQPHLVAGCTCKGCPLHQYRLSSSQRYQKRQQGDDSRDGNELKTIATQGAA